MRTVVAIVGPTASGKSELAALLAHRLGSRVVSVDSMQVYRGMDIGTAKVPPSGRQELDMVDVCDLTCDYSVELFQSQARACVDALLAAGRTPVLCGGTGLYLDAVIDEMDFAAGRAGDGRREAYEALAAEHGAAWLHAQLEARDPDAAALIHPNNVRRVIRALEMADEGRSYATENERLHDREPHYDARIWALVCDRERLYRRIDERVDAMFEAGLVDEVRALAASGLRESRTASQAIGYKEVLEALDGQVSMEEARDTIKLRTRRYAKRQLSWIRRDGRARPLDTDVLTTREACDLIVEDLRREASHA